VQRWVSERDQFPGYKPEEPKAWTPAHAVGNVMDQFAKLDEVYAHMQPLLRQAQNYIPADVAAALKSVGKYGDRLASGAKSAGGGMRWRRIDAESPRLRGESFHGKFGERPYLG
jgi:hypothetical protein